MKIELEDKNTTAYFIGNFAPGEVFVIASGGLNRNYNFWMKIQPIGEYNAVRLEDGYPAKFVQGDKLWPVDGKFICQGRQ
jgi:hypothetical protein